jgi:hypothetical protein
VAAAPLWRPRENTPIPTPTAPSAIKTQPHHGTSLPEPPVVEAGVTTTDFDVVV